MAAERAKLNLQAILGGLDEETVQQLLQTAITKKTKDSSQHVIATSSSAEVDQTGNDEVMKSDLQLENKDAIDNDVAGLEVQINVGIDGGDDQAIKTDNADLSQNTSPDEQENGSHISLDDLEIDTVPVLVSGTANSSEENDKESTKLSQSPSSSTSSLHVLELQSEPEQDLTPTSDILNNSTSSNLITQIQDQDSSIFIPLDNESTDFDKQQLQTGDDEKAVSIPDEEHDAIFDTKDQHKTPFTSKQPASGLYQQTKNEHGYRNIAIPTDELAGTQPDTTLANDQFNAALNQPLNRQSPGFDQEVCDEKLTFIPVEEHNGTQHDKSSSNDEFNSLFSSNEPSTSAEKFITSGHELLSNNPFTHSSHRVQLAPSSSSLYCKNEKDHSPVLTQDVSSQDFPSVVPPLLISLSKVSQYLPEGIVTFNAEMYIPLALKPAIVLKDQVAVMVFERDDGASKNYEKPAQSNQYRQLEEEEERDTTQLRPLQKHDQSTTYLNQQPLHEEQAHDENQAFQQGSNPFSEAFNDQKQPSQVYFNEEQQKRAEFLKQQQQDQGLRDQQQQYQQQQHDQGLRDQQQQYQQQQHDQGLRDQQQQYQQQQHEQGSRDQQYQQQQHDQGSRDQQQQYQQQQEQQYRKQLQRSQDQQQQQRQAHTQPFQQPFQQPLQNSGQRENEPSQQARTVLSESSYPYPSASQQVLRSSSLPYPPTNTQNEAPLTLTHEQQQKLQSKLSVPGLKKPDVWMKDEDCKSCINCGRPFSVTRRKHHCRACGKIFCGDCCDQLAQLPYLGRRVAKICVSCTRAIKRAHSDLAKRKKEAKGQTNSRAQSSSASHPNRTNVSSSTTNRALLHIPSDKVNQTQSPASSLPEGNFNVPQGTNDAYQSLATSEGNFNPVGNLMQSRPDDPVQAMPSSIGSRLDFKQDGGLVKRSWKIPSHPAGRTITWTENDSNASLDEQKKRFKNLNKALKNQEGAVIQAATLLSVSAKKIRVVVKQGLHEAWFLCSHGFASCGQKEIAFVLEKRLNEDVFPYEMLKVFRTLYSLILNQGERFEHCSYLAFNNPLLGSEENVGFIFIALNKAPKLVQNHAPFKSLLFGILLKQSELPCAKYMPTRLINALGVQQQCFPSPALSSRDRPSVCSIEPNELFYSTFFAFNQFLNHKIPQALIPDVHVLKSGSKVILELPFVYQTEIINVLDSLLVDESKPVSVPIAGDLVPGSSGHFVYSARNVASARRGFVVLQNSNAQTEPGNQYLAFSAILLVLTFGDACNSQTRFGIEVIEDGITVTLSDSQAREIRQAIYQGTNCAMSVGNSADSKEQFTLRWLSDTCPSILQLPTPMTVLQPAKKSGRGNFPAVVSTPTSVRADAGQTNVVIERVKTRDVEAAIKTKITGEEPQRAVSQLENDVRQACGGCLLTFANRLQLNAEKRLNLTLELGPGNYKKWKLGPNNQPINLARSLQLALKEIDVPDVNDNIMFVFNVILQKRN